MLAYARYLFEVIIPDIVLFLRFIQNRSNVYKVKLNRFKKMTEAAHIADISVNKISSSKIFAVAAATPKYPFS